MKNRLCWSTESAPYPKQAVSFHIFETACFLPYFIGGKEFFSILSAISLFVQCHFHNCIPLLRQRIAVAGVVIQEEELVLGILL